MLEPHLDGDGAAVLVQAWATLHDGGMIDVLVWNGTINADLFRGDQRLDRRISLTLDNLPAIAYTTELARVDEHHSNIVEWLPAATEWPDAEEMSALRTHDVLHTESLGVMTPVDRGWTIDFELPLPGVVRVRCRPAPSPPIVNSSHQPGACT